MNIQEIIYIKIKRNEYLLNQEIMDEGDEEEDEDSE